MKNLPYYILKNWVKISLKLFYRSVDVKGLKHLQGGGKLLVANHQNTLIDALLLVCFLPGRTYFMTRADVVNKRTKKILGYLGIIPIYRQHDGFRAVAKSNDSIEQAIAHLKNGSNVVIFPEGTHQVAQKIRTFKKGFLRLLDDDKPEVVPVALWYEDHLRSFSSTGINILSSISVDPEEINTLPKLAEEAIREVSIHFDEPSSAKQNALYTAFSEKNIAVKNWEKLVRFSTSDDFNDDSTLKAIRPFNTCSSLGKAILNLLLSLCSFPIALIGLLIRVPFDFIINKISSKMVKDQDFAISIRFALTAFFMPLIYGVFSLLILGYFHFHLEGILLCLFLYFSAYFYSIWKETLVHTIQYLKLRS